MNWAHPLMQFWDWYSTDFNQWSLLILFYVGTPIQVMFVLLFFTRKWAKYTFSRAIMWKSASLAALMYASDCKVLVAGLRNYDWPWWIDLQTPIINLFVFWAITNQLRALVVTIREGDLDSMENEVKNQ